MKHIKNAYIPALIILSTTVSLLLFSCENTAPKRIDIALFGAMPDDDKNDCEAFRLAMKFCRENPGTTLYIPTGIYNLRDEEAAKIEYEAISGKYGEDVQGKLFKPDAPYVIGLDLTGSKDITIEADGATILLEGWYETISIVNAKNITIKGFALKHKRPPFTTGNIVNTTTDYFDIQIDTLRYPFIKDSVTGRIHFFDIEKQRIYTGAWHERKEWIDEQTVRIYSKATPKKGDLCILRHSAHYRPAVMIKESSDIRVENLKIHSHPGMGIVGHRSENITLKNLQVIPAAGTVVSTNTDATHFTSCKGEIILDACKFGGQGDDCTNIHNYYWSVYNGENPKEIFIAVEKADLHALSPDYPDKGDTLSLVSRYDISTVDNYIVSEVDTSAYSKNSRIKVILDKHITSNTDDYYMTNMTRRPSVKILNNTVRSHMARAYLIKSRNVRIEGNVIQSCSGTAIQLGAEAGWRESAPVENILIENNWIIGCGYGHGKQKGSAISVSINGIKTDPTLANKNIVIRNNVIQAEGENAIYVSAAKNITITDNDIKGSMNAIYTEFTDSVTVKDNGILPVFINGMMK